MRAAILLLGCVACFLAAHMLFAYQLLTGRL